MKQGLKIGFYLFISLFTNDLVAQNRFGGGLVLGLNAAQIEGDVAAGYNRIGTSVGLRGTIHIGFLGKWQLATDILYSQRGAKSTTRDRGFLRALRTQYLEVPVLLSLCDWLVTDKQGHDYYKVHFSAGLSYGRLFSSERSDKWLHPQVAVDLFAKNDIAYTAGLSYFVNRHWGFSWRYTRSLNYLYDRTKYPNDAILVNLNSLKGYFLTFQTVWIF